MGACFLMAMSAGSLFGTGAAPVELPQDRLQGRWLLVAAERDGQAAKDIEGHVLTFFGDRFLIRAKDGGILYAGTYSLADGQPGAIDFRHTGKQLKGTTWKGIWSLNGDTLKICDNAPDVSRDRPTAFAAGAGSGHVSITFQRARN